MSLDPDAEDVQAVLAGDVERFAGIVERWQERLVSLAFRFARDPARAEEMAQEAFLRCYRRLGEWRREARFGTWLYSVALNCYRSSLRRRPPRQEPLPSGLGSDEGITAGLLVAERAETVRRELARLPALYREALALYYLEEQDLAATAAALGVPAGTLKARLHRGRELLRKRLEGVPGWQSSS
jgi:RNA polymerase sigma-70 factor (ECF subfamily)